MTRVCIDIDSETGNPGPTVKTYSTVVGDGAQSDFVVDHNLNYQGVIVQAYNANTGEVNQNYSVGLTSANRATLSFDTPPAPNSTRVQVLGVIPAS